MSHAYRQLMLEQKIMMGMPAIASASLRIGRSAGPRTTRPRKRASSASAKPRKSASKLGQAKRGGAANPNLHRFNNLEARFAKPPRKAKAGRRGSRTVPGSVFDTFGTGR